MRRAARRTIGASARRSHLAVTSAGPSTITRHSSQSATKTIPWSINTPSGSASKASARDRVASKWAPIPTPVNTPGSNRPPASGWGSSFTPQQQQQPNPRPSSFPAFNLPTSNNPRYPPAGPASKPSWRSSTGEGSEPAWPARLPPSQPRGFPSRPQNQRPAFQSQGRSSRLEDDSNWQPRNQGQGHALFAAPGMQPLPASAPGSSAQAVPTPAPTSGYPASAVGQQQQQQPQYQSFGYAPPTDMQQQLHQSRTARYTRGSMSAELFEDQRYRRARGRETRSRREELMQDDDEYGHSRRTVKDQKQQQQKVQRAKRPKQVRVQKDVYIPTVVSVSNLARIVGMRQRQMMDLMVRWGMEDVKPDLLLSAEDASLVAVELGYNPVIDDEAAFDIYPDPPHPEPTTLPHRPPVVTIMGHVDHGKTTLLDTLRSTSVAKGEAGGITQHIGAFSVPVPNVSEASGIKTITFLDTPGHAAFTAMRARGASVTDIIVCVVAADDGVMPQTREVLNLAKNEEDVQLVIAINKVDNPGADVEKVKHALLAEGVQLEDMGGDVPSVEVSGLTGQGLDNLVETISTIAEVADLRAERDSKAEGYVLESKVDKGRGPIATVLVLRGTLKGGDAIVAGTTWCRVRQMMDDKGKSVKEALPGDPVTVAGWKELPIAGDEVLQAVEGENDAKRAIENRKREQEKRDLLADVEKINESRKAERIEREEQALAEATGTERAQREEDDGPKELRLVIKGDVSGTVEAVVGSVSGIGNDEVKTKVISSGVGEVVESDVAMAEAAGAMIIGFNVKCQRSVQQLASAQHIPLYFDDVIYRVMEEVRKRASALLPPAIEKHVKGEAQVAEIFNITIKGRKTHAIAGCRVLNGAVEKSSRVRVQRNGEDVWEGQIEELKHLKKDITEAKKGMDCGIAFAGFEGMEVGDVIQAIEVKEIARQV